MAESGEDHNALRRLARDEHGMKTSRFGSNNRAMTQLVAMKRGGVKNMPLANLSKEERVRATKEKYSDAIESTDLETLGKLFPQQAWDDFVQHGVCSHALGLSSHELRMLRVVDRTLLAEMGIDPRDETTHPNGWVCVGYDSVKGWLRTPAISLGQFHVATHPRVYARLVGLYARMLDRQGYGDTTENRRACIELRFQCYNHKLRLSSEKTESIEHTDWDWRCDTKRPDGSAVPIGMVPAPQCVMCTSPQVHLGQRVWRGQFVDLVRPILASPYFLSCATLSFAPSFSMRLSFFLGFRAAWPSRAGNRRCSAQDAGGGEAPTKRNRLCDATPGGRIDERQGCHRRSALCRI